MKERPQRASAPCPQPRLAGSWVFPPVSSPRSTRVCLFPSLPLHCPALCGPHRARDLSVFEFLCLRVSASGSVLFSVCPRPISLESWPFSVPRLPLSVSPSSFLSRLMPPLLSRDHHCPRSGFFSRPLDSGGQCSASPHQASSRKSCVSSHSAQLGCPSVALASGLSRARSESLPARLLCPPAAYCAEALVLPPRVTLPGPTPSAHLVAHGLART